jgi:hypothetical protein
MTPQSPFLLPGITKTWAGSLYCQFCLEPFFLNIPYAINDSVLHNRAAITMTSADS